MVMIEIAIDILIILFLSLLCASTSYFLDYCLGRPQAAEDEIGVGEIFFFYTLMLSKKRLKREGDDFASKLDDMNEGLKVNGFRKESTTDPFERNEQRKDREAAIVVRARSYFTWEKALGMCIYCTGFWISALIVIISSVVFAFSLFQFFALLLCVPPIAHTLLRRVIN